MDKKLIIWPLYFDAKKSRNEGRRVSKNLSVENPSLELIAKAAIKAGYNNIEVDKDSRHPATWFEYKGRIVVYSNESKQKVLRKIGTALKEIMRKERR